MFLQNLLVFWFISECNVSRLDLWFLIDGSGSIGSNNFQTCLRFVNQTATTFNIAPDKVRTGLMIYSSSTTTRSLFNQHQSTQEFSRIVLSTSYPRGKILIVKNTIQIRYKHGNNEETLPLFVFFFFFLQQTLTP